MKTLIEGTGIDIGENLGEINTVDLLPSASLGAELTNLPDTLIFALVGQRQEMGTGINDFHV